MTEKNHESSFSITPGKLLSAAREACGFSLTDITKQTRLSMQTICDIEKDDYAQIGARTFIRGYLCTYARLVNVSKTQILEALETSGLMPAETYSTLPIIESVPVTNVTHLRSRSLNTRWILGFISALILIALIIWWQDTALSSKEISIKHAQTKINEPTVTTTLSQPDVVSVKQNNALAAKSAVTKLQPITTLSNSTTVPVVEKMMKREKKTNVFIKKDSAVNIRNKSNNVINGFVTKPLTGLHTTYTISSVS